MYTHRLMSRLCLTGCLVLPTAALAQSPAPTPTPPPALPSTPALPALSAPSDPPIAVKKSDALLTADRLRDIWTGPNKALFEPAFLRTERQNEPAWKPDDATTALLGSAQKDIEELLKVLAGPAADWQVRTKEEGFAAKVPHWAQLTTTSRVLFADARRLLARASEGDADAAVQRLIGIINLAKHFQNERLVGAVRTGRQLAVNALLEAKRLADAGSLSQAAKAKLLDAAKPFDVSDPLDIKGALVNEAQITIETTKRVCLGPDAANIFIATFAPRAKPEEIDQTGVRTLDQAALHRQVESIALCYREVAANWDSPQALEAIKAIAQQRAAGDFGGPAALINPELQHLRASTFRMANLVAEVIRSLGGTPRPTTP